MQVVVIRTYQNNVVHFCRYKEGNKSAVADAKTAVVEANAWSSTTKNGTLQLARAGDTRT